MLSKSTRESVLRELYRRCRKAIYLSVIFSTLTSSVVIGTSCLFKKVSPLVLRARRGESIEFTQNTRSVPKDDQLCIVLRCSYAN
jgi:hypothetical protein